MMEKSRTDSASAIASAKRITLVLFGAGAVAVYVAFLDLKQDDLHRYFGYLEKMLKVQDMISDKLAMEAQPVAFADSGSIDVNLHLRLYQSQVLCRGYLSGILETGPESAETLCARLYADEFPTIPVDRIFTPIPRWSRHDHVYLRTDLANDCGFLLYRGEKEAVFALPGIPDMSEVTEVNGDQIFLIDFYTSCLTRSRYDDPPMLWVDMREEFGIWYYSTGPSLMSMLITDMAFSRLQQTDLWSEPGRSSSFDLDQFIHTLPTELKARYGERLGHNIRFFRADSLTQPALRRVYHQTGIMFMPDEIEEAIATAVKRQVYAPTLLGVSADSAFWAPLLPVVVLVLCFLFRHRVRRIDFSAELREPWIFLGTQGMIERLGAGLFGIFILLVPGLTAWSVMVLFDAQLPGAKEVRDLGVMLQIRESWQGQLLLKESVVIPASAGVVAFVVSEIFLISSLRRIWTGGDGKGGKLWLKVGRGIRILWKRIAGQRA